jgi:hypothetical protein
VLVKAGADQGGTRPNWHTPVARVTILLDVLQHLTVAFRRTRHAVMRVLQLCYAPCAPHILPVSAVQCGPSLAAQHHRTAARLLSSGHTRADR